MECTPHAVALCHHFPQLIAYVRWERNYKAPHKYVPIIILKYARKCCGLFILPHRRLWGFPQFVHDVCWANVLASVWYMRIYSDTAQINSNVQTNILMCMMAMHLCKFRMECSETQHNIASFAALAHIICRVWDIMLFGIWLNVIERIEEIFA